MKKILSFIMIISMLLGMIAMTSFGQTAGDVDTSNNLYAYSKTATELYEDLYTDVTLTVGGNENQLGSDIIYIIGSYATNNDGTPNVEGDLLISSLVETIEDIVKVGTHVNFGIVPFSSDSEVAMPLTKIDAENIDELETMIAQALMTCEAVYDGVNMENALIKAKKMFSESELAGRPERQHLVMISSGQTYFFNTGDNNEYLATVPVNLYSGSTNKIANALFYTAKAWQRARTNQTNTYPIPKGIVDEYNANPDKYDNLWDCYWTYIDIWAKADVAAGDSIVYEATTVEAGDFINWFTVYKKQGDESYFKYSSYGAVIHDATQEDIDNSVLIRPGSNPLTDATAAHAIGHERAMWEAYNFLQENIVSEGINFYPIYNELKPQYTNGNTEWCTWTDQYIGHNFMNFLAGGTAVVYNKQSDKTFFDPIKDEIISYLSIGTTVEDYIGFSDDATEGYNFEFIDMINGEAKLPVLKVGNKTYITTKLETAVEGATFSYVFAAEEGAEPTFAMDYYYGNGTTEEMFIWTFNENVTKHANVSLTYTLELAQRSTVVGEHVAHTNILAVLHPIDSENVAGTDEYFERPFVKYVVLPETISVSVVKVWEDEDNAEGLRPDSIIVNLYADGELVATQEITANDEWKFVFENLAKFDGEEVIEYTLTENEVDEYYTEITGNYIEGFVITNSLEEDIPDNPPPLDPPKTGDATVLFVILGLAAVVAGSTLVIRTRKEI